MARFHEIFQSPEARRPEAKNAPPAQRGKSLESCGQFTACQEVYCTSLTRVQRNFSPWRPSLVTGIATDGILELVGPIKVTGKLLSDRF